MKNALFVLSIAAVLFVLSLRPGTEAGEGWANMPTSDTVVAVETAPAVAACNCDCDDCCCNQATGVVMYESVPMSAVTYGSVGTSFGYSNLQYSAHESYGSNGSGYHSGHGHHRGGFFARRRARRRARWHGRAVKNMYKASHM